MILVWIGGCNNIFDIITINTCLLLFFYEDDLTSLLEQKAYAFSALMKWIFKYLCKLK